MTNRDAFKKKKKTDATPMTIMMNKCPNWNSCF